MGADLEESKETRQERPDIGPVSDAQISVWRWRREQ
ncbi:hypothetical protein COLO4_20751 [Corchorus olitorius]|uniref:Uncharacterized protein n=1 Tax=Corchorus olitorius TaxID=93759 RepID=A0A1R3IX74_9ROSI|nr:hypothetical protein COLO4_20751 [Corchorus olitorius]